MNIQDEYMKRRYEMLRVDQEPREIFVSCNLLDEFMCSVYPCVPYIGNEQKLFGVPFYRVLEKDIFRVL